MFYNNINPIILKIGFLEIRYYGLIYVLSFIIAYFLISYLAKKKKIKLKKDDIIDFLFYLIIGLVIGARLFYILFYNLKFYFANPLEIFVIWHGGMSFHGGLVGGVISGFIFCRKKKIDFFEIADLVVIPLALGLMLGRIGNFINSELVGRVTNVPWCFKFEGYDGCRHPSQLYESFKNLIIFITLWILKNKKLAKGFLFWTFILMYSVLRFFIGFYRVPDPQLGFILFNLTMGQILNIIMFFTALVFIIRLKREV